MSASHKDGKKHQNEKGDEDMVMIKEKANKIDKSKMSRQELREKLIRKTIEKNYTVLKRLSKT